MKHSGYSSNSSTSFVPKVELERSVLELNPLIEWDKSLSEFKFRYSLVMEFFVAEKIKQELIRFTAASLTKEPVKIQEDILLNQDLIRFRTRTNLTIQILCDAIKDERISTDFLYDLVGISRQKRMIPSSSTGVKTEDDKFQEEKNDEQEEHNTAGTTQQHLNKIKIDLDFNNNNNNNNNNKENISQSHFETAAANAMTILNNTDFSFRDRDLSDVHIKGANLSYGYFKRTNFKNANLQKVNFTGVQLKNTNLERANLQGVDFGEDSCLKILDNSIGSIAFSSSGNYLAVEINNETDNETLVYEILDSRCSSFKKIKTFPGKFFNIVESPYDVSNEQILTLLVNEICIWDLKSGESLKKIDTDYKSIISISLDMKKIVFRDDKQNSNVFNRQKKERRMG